MMANVAKTRSSAKIGGGVAIFIRNNFSYIEIHYEQETIL